MSIKYNLFTKKVISMNYGSSTSSWKPWRWRMLDMILMMRDIYINSRLNSFTEFTSNNRSTDSKDILPWSISQIIIETIPITKRTVKIYVMKQHIRFWVWPKVNGNWENNMIRFSQWKKSPCRRNNSVRRKK